MSYLYMLLAVDYLEQGQRPINWLLVALFCLVNSVSDLSLPVNSVLELLL